MVSCHQRSSSWRHSVDDDAQVFFLAMAYVCWVVAGGVALFFIGVSLWP